MIARRRRLHVTSRALLACVAGLVATSCTEPTRPPNVLLILVDDLGFGDLGVNGGAHARTPNIDRFASEGARFTRHYSDSSCAPARAALLTGRYAARDGFRPRGRGIPQEVTTLPERLRDHGYATRHIGKWHLGGTGIWGLDASPASALPSAQGFDHWFGFLDSLLLGGPDASSGDIPTPRYRAGRYLKPWLHGSHAPGSYYEGHLTDVLTDRAIDFVRRPPKEPWFLNLWYLAPHAPIQPHPRHVGHDIGTPPSLYRALVEQLDESVGRLLTALAESGQAERTVVVLLSDNGGSTRYDATSNRPFPGRKLGYEEGGIRTPLLIRWPGRVEPETVVDAPVSIMDLYPTLAAWTGAPPGQTDGRDLSPLLEGARLPERPLFWEQMREDGPYYSVLSEDGRFRLLRWTGKPILLDLIADPHGTADVSHAHPDEVARLDALHGDWRREVSRIQVDVDTDADGRGVARGNDLQRSPGWGGFTFGVGITPESRDGSSELDEVVAYQEGLWELTRSQRDALRLRLGKTRLKGRKLTMDECNAVIVTGQFLVSTQVSGNNRASLALFLNGVPQEELDDVPLPPHTDLSAPTLLGLAAGDSGDLHGRLGKPLFLNTRVVSHPGSSEQAAAEFTDELCPPPA